MPSASQRTRPARDTDKLWMPGSTRMGLSVEVRLYGSSLSGEALIAAGPDPLAGPPHPRRRSGFRYRQILYREVSFPMPPLRLPSQTQYCFLSNRNTSGSPQIRLALTAEYILGIYSVATMLRACHRLIGSSSTPENELKFNYLLFTTVDVASCRSRHKT
jgi:hypothetical protein